MRSTLHAHTRALTHAHRHAGRAKILDTDREVVALHRERYVFPVSIRVSRASGAGADALFLGLVRVRGL